MRTTVSRETGAWVEKLNCPQIPHIRTIWSCPSYRQAYGVETRRWNHCLSLSALADAPQLVEHGPRSVAAFAELAAGKGPQRRCRQLHVRSSKLTGMRCPNRELLTRYDRNVVDSPTNADRPRIPRHHLTFTG